MVGAEPSSGVLERIKWKGLDAFVVSPEVWLALRISPLRVPKLRPDAEEEARLAGSLERARLAYDADLDKIREAVAAPTKPFDESQLMGGKGVFEEVQYAYATHPGIPAYNEDNVSVEVCSVEMGGIRENVHLFGVYDGHGAGRAENDAVRFLRDNLERHLAKEMGKGLREGYTKPAMRRLLKRLFLPLQEKFLGYRSYMGGTTVTFGVYVRGDFWTMQLGDSGAEWLDETTVVPLTETADVADPRYLKRMIRSGSVAILHMSETEEGYIPEARGIRGGAEGPLLEGLNMARSFGDRFAKGTHPIPKITCIRPKGGVVALYSDGLTGDTPRATLTSWIRDAVAAFPGDLLSAARQLIQQTYAGGSEDNMTCMLIRLPETGE